MSFQPQILHFDKNFPTREKFADYLPTAKNLGAQLPFPCHNAADLAPGVAIGALETRAF